MKNALTLNQYVMLVMHADILLRKNNPKVWIIEIKKILGGWEPILGFEYAENELARAEGQNINFRLKGYITRIRKIKKS